MTLHIDLTPEQEARIHAAAHQNGIAPAEVVKRLVEEHLPPLSPDQESAPNDSKAHVRALLAQWQAQDSTPRRLPIPTRNGETPTEALFRKWEEEDAAMTEEEHEAADRFWEEFQQEIDAERAKAGMRTLF